MGLLAPRPGPQLVLRPQLDDAQLDEDDEDDDPQLDDQEDVSACAVSG